MIAPTGTPKPALFYFQAHSEAHELMTRTLVDLIGRAAAVFNEWVTPAGMESETARLEADFNKYLAEGVASPDFRRGVLDNPNNATDQFLVSHMRGKGKRMVFERTIEAAYNLNQCDTETSRAFFDDRLTLQHAMLIKEEFLSATQSYHESREQDVARQISEIPETVVVIFGVAHPQLERKLSEYRPTESHFPYPDYVLTYENRMIQNFRATRCIDRELYLKAMLEGMVLKGIRAKHRASMTEREMDLVANHYATIFSEEQIVNFRDYVILCSRLMGFSTAGGVLQGITGPYATRAGAAIGYSFESYLAKESMPSIESVLGTLRDNNPEPDYKCGFAFPDESEPAPEKTSGDETQPGEPLIMSPDEYFAKYAIKL